jgi:hypothetical protein
LATTFRTEVGAWQNPSVCVSIDSWCSRSGITQSIPVQGAMTNPRAQTERDWAYAVFMLPHRDVRMT